MLGIEQKLSNLWEDSGMKLPYVGQFAAPIFRRSLGKVTLYSILNLSSGIFGASAIAAEVTPPDPSFTELCLNRISLSPQTQSTVEALLQQVDTADCHQAAQRLNSLTEINLSDRQLSDLSPLASLTQLNKLNLAKNQIRDIRPLQSLTKLTELDLAGNQISDLSPLQSLVKIKKLDLRQNQIWDYTPLQYLWELETVDL
jgi:internalin A